MESKSNLPAELQSAREEIKTIKHKVADSFAELMKKTPGPAKRTMAFGRLMEALDACDVEFQCIDKLSEPPK